MRPFTSAVFLSVLLIAGVMAQQAPVYRLTIEDAVRLGLEHNPDLKSARYDVDRADARVQEAWGYALPAVDLSSRFTKTLKKPVFFLPDFANPSSGKTVPIAIGSNYSVDAGITARQILFNGTVFVGVGASSVYAEVARDFYRSKQLETVTSVKKAFFRSLLAREAADMMRSSLKNAEDNLRNVNLLMKQGVLSEYDGLRAAVAVDNLRPAVIQSETNVVLTLDGLKNAVGLNPDERVELAGVMQFTPPDDSLLSLAPSAILDVNPTYAAVRKQVAVNEAFVLAERSNYLPTISAFGNYQYQYAKNTTNISTNDFIASSQIGLQLTMSLFQGLQTNAKVQQAQVDVRKSQEQMLSMERGLRTGLTATVGNLRAAKLRIEAQQKTVEQAERGYKIVTARFLSGSATQLEVNDADLALTQAKVNRIQALYDFLVASAELDQYLGRFPAYITPTKID